MRPSQLEYKRLVSDQHYGNVQVGLVCELGPSDDVDEVLAMMKRTVHSSLYWALLNGGTNPNAIRIGEGTPQVEVADCNSCWRSYPAASLADGKEYGFRSLCPRCAEKQKAMVPVRVSPEDIRPVGSCDEESDAESEGNADGVIDNAG